MARTAFSRTFLLPAVAALGLGCAAAPHRFPLREPIWQDTDQAPVSVACRPDPEAAAKGEERKLCLPEAYVSPFAWDAADNILFRPLSRFFAFEHAGEATNVNSLD